PRCLGRGFTIGAFCPQSAHFGHPRARDFSLGSTRGGGLGYLGREGAVCARSSLPILINRGQVLRCSVRITDEFKSQDLSPVPSRARSGFTLLKALRGGS